MTRDVQIPDPLDLDRDEEARLRRVAGLAPTKAPAGEYAGFESVGLPDRPPQTEREREVYTLEEGEMLVNMGPQHPSTHGVMRLVAKVRGEVVTDIDPVLGYLHRGIEKLCEEATYTTVLTYVDPMDYLATMHNEHAPAIAFEKLFGIRAPRRAEYIRALVVELNRVFSHSLMMGFLALDMGGITPILYGFINRDEIVEMLSAISGQRMLFNFFRVGGVNWDTNDEFLSRLGTWRSHVLKNVEMSERVITDNEIFRARTIGMGTLSGQEAIALGVSGPNLRASGVSFDVRTARPYSIYPELEFEVITHPGGDSNARYLQRIAEIKQSIHLIDQIVDKMPHGPVQAQVPGIIRPKPGRAYAAIESPRGLYSVYAISDGGPTPYRFRMRDPSFVSLQAIPKLMPGHLIADTMAVMASFDPVMGGVDK
ncbi:MAG TPA: NADH-quinone oxidoreductase subunit D [Candidatus Limnocylindria bacterium]|jgi:NADH-quinone oxidoreductase subunit D|nr:NADH-quinone oxidoreductase subunit D [Candidatus Limnocylindria bacterium]